ncbi:MAG: hypothetical protein DI611_11540 [Brachybacterium faecium]|nr:MAG: hypothetical protein DI611_11540 [Brachybacterium faecium]
MDHGGRYHGVDWSYVISYDIYAGADHIGPVRLSPVPSAPETAAPPPAAPPPAAPPPAAPPPAAPGPRTRPRRPPVQEPCRPGEGTRGHPR